MTVSSAALSLSSSRVALFFKNMASGIGRCAGLQGSSLLVWRRAEGTERREEGAGWIIYSINHIQRLPSPSAQ